MIENVALIKSFDSFSFNENKIYVYHLVPRDNGLLLKFLYTTNFGFSNKYGLRFTIDKKFKGDLFCTKAKVKEHIMRRRDILNPETAELEIDGVEQRKNRFKTKKKFLRGYNLIIANRYIGELTISCSKIEAVSISQVGKNEFNQNVKELMETKSL